MARPKGKRAITGQNVRNGQRWLNRDERQQLRRILNERVEAGQPVTSLMRREARAVIVADRGHAMTTHSDGKRYPCCGRDMVCHGGIEDTL